jgi:acetyl/propionyl-CoA carboxylase alpha subunit
VQRRHQKLIEETPSSVIDDATRTRPAGPLTAASTALPAAGRVHRHEDGDFYFLR